MEPNVLTQLAAELAALQQNVPGGVASPLSMGRRAADTTPTTNYMTGPGGIFGVAGAEQEVIHTMVRPMGLASVLPAFGMPDTENPLFPYLTGITDVSGSDPEGVCDDPQQVGEAKNCFLTAQFGRYSFETEALEVNRLGEKTNRGEFHDIRLINAPLAQQLENVTPTLPDGSLNPLVNDVAMAWTKMGVALQRKLIPQTYQGTPANNTAGGGYQEFPGLDTLISTGKIDALNGSPCGALNSDIKDMNYACVGSSAATNESIIRAIVAIWRTRNYIAETTGLSPVQWVITMRQSLFWELTDIWPCSYLTYRCIISNDDGQRVNVDAGDAIALRDDMRNNKYLLIDGVRVNVVIDSGIDEETDADSANIAAGSFASDIYFIPLTVLGGMPVTFWNFKDFGKTPNGPDSAITLGRYSDEFWHTDAGRFLWHKKPSTAWCVQWQIKTEPRLILRTPHLAGRLTNVCYSPLQHERDPFPSDPYFADGGNTSRASTSLYSEWNTSGPGLN